MKKGRRKKITRKMRETLIGYSFIGIWIVGFLVFMLYPLINSFIFSLSNVQIMGTGIQTTYQGFKNYLDIFKIEEGFVFLEALIAFLKELVLQVPIIIVFSVLIALLLNQPVKGRGIYRSIFFLPVIISSGPVINELISLGATGASIFDTYGFISIIENNLSSTFATPVINIFTKIIIIFWFSGVQILVFLAGLQKVNKQTYEAAKVDGADRWQSFWKITFPSLSSLIFINTIYTIVLLATFSENEVIVSIKTNMFNIKTGYGMASAMAWLYSIVVLLIIGAIALIFYPKMKKGKH